MKQPVDAVNNVVVLYKLATVSLLYASLHSSDEAGLIFQHPRHCILHQLLGILAAGNGHLFEPRFDFGREMHFHEAQSTGKSPGWQGSARSAR